MIPRNRLKSHLQAYLAKDDNLLAQVDAALEASLKTLNDPASNSASDTCGLERAELETRERNRLLPVHSSLRITTTSFPIGADAVVAQEPPEAVSSLAVAQAASLHEFSPAFATPVPPLLELDDAEVSNYLEYGFTCVI